MVEKFTNITPYEFGDDAQFHLHAVRQELEWLSELIAARLGDFAAGSQDSTMPAPPDLLPDAQLTDVIIEAELDRDGRAVLALALASHLSPSLLDPFFVRNQTLDRPFTEFGGQTIPNGTGFMPTGETALFLVGGTSILERSQAMRFFDPDHPMRQMNLVSLTAPQGGGPMIAGSLTMTPDQVAFVTTGQLRKPDYSTDFPARRLTTPLSWDDLVLSPEVMDQLQHIASWLEHEGRILHDWGLARTLAPGYRALFYGPPGTGKTLTASLLGQRANMDVYRIDLSQVVSKYIGETEKNLASVFDQAEKKNWILFFDEADSLFGNRSSGSSSNDRHANQEVAYLLQRIEVCPSLVILATNLRGNLDDAFSRRFQSLVGFTKPNAEERLRLWRGVLGSNLPLGNDVDLGVLARNHELAGGAIVNVVRHAAISALRRGEDAVGQADLRAAIAMEVRKEGRTA